jgi:ribonuclease P protein component
LTFHDERGLRFGCASGAVKHEENVSAEQSASEANTRVSRAHGDSRRTERVEAAAGQGAQEADGIDPSEAAGVTPSRPASFPKHARLRSRGEYLRVQRDGRRQHTEQFVVLTASAACLNSRIGITVSSRVGNAVVRNRVKRLVREIAREAWRAMDPPGDVVIIAKPSAAETTHAKAAIQLRRALGVSRT